MLNLILILAYNDFKSNRGYEILLFYRHREPSGLALALREAIPHSWNDNRVHSLTHEKGVAS